MSTIPVSSVPAVVAYLKSAIQAQLDTDPTASSIGLYVGDNPTPDRPNDTLNIGSGSRRMAPGAFVGGGGTNWLEEGYDIAVTVRSWRGGNTGTEATQRAWQLVGYIETAVRLTPGLGGLVQIAYPIASDWEGPEFTDDPQGFGYEITEAIHCRRLA